MDDADKKIKKKSRRTLQEEYKADQQKELDALTHKNKMKWLNLCTNPLTSLLIVAFFVVAWYCKWDWRNAMLVCGTYLLEWLIIQWLNKNKQ